MTNIMESLQAEFPVEQLGWKIINTFESQGRFFAFVAPFVDARAIQDRFDEVFGIDNWQVSYEKWGEKATKCTISVFLNERWISKEDGSEESDYSSVKGGFSNSLKRAAVLWGVGRYLYNVKPTKVELSTCSNGPNSIYISYQKKGYYFIPPTMLQQKHKQGSSKKEPSNGQVSLGVLIQNIQELAKPLSITSKEILLAYNHNYNAQARTFEDTTIGGLEGILTSLQLIHEAKNIRPGNEKQLNRWLSALIPGDVTSFREWLLHDHTEAIHQLIQQLKKQQSA
ncbi:Rad52/Rad22 family DNA repair protein [Bacillus paranthracis]|uniref:Rad52/Rad22 family DNA repair protein n=1 Tax=Bacillus cereus group TaxID=86661 RepID=UPI0002F32CC6|nr:MULTISPECIES: Rad52/Rad22 family DNA repair protein [Bacillus cereus group]MCU5059032.1 Rad52/Rad22 family DNA repair protein [Bacillus cereus]MDA2138962.1 Rad52/Rad22 family DNA repair protein [Bacillus cereus group sp. Bc256]MDA2598360.1 Rad52/Rad22 family DNA repair protein [Bacillus cereus group sp. Bc061]MDK7541820.1 Rad52/Rad22 family DNA repair protein [Bacillus paranthracis]MDK7563749.1 Rad52/Rad22 family DNA repair protein [Bacillus paranthracis]